MTVFDDLRKMEQELESLTHSMSELNHESSDYSQVAERFHRVENELRTRDAYTVESQVGAVLQGLGFGKQDWTRRTEEFSGGWQMRISLASFCYRNRTCYCSTSRLITLTLKPATGLRIISARIRMRMC